MARRPREERGRYLFVACLGHLIIRWPFIPFETEHCVPTPSRDTSNIVWARSTQYVSSVSCIKNKFCSSYLLPVLAFCGGGGGPETLRRVLTRVIYDTGSTLNLVGPLINLIDLINSNPSAWVGTLKNIEFYRQDTNDTPTRQSCLPRTWKLNSVFLGQC